jgi:hypothetical protein
MTALRRSVCLALPLIVSLASTSAHAILICKGDVNTDGVRDGADIQRFGDALIAGSGGNFNATWAADMDGSTIIDSTDLTLFVDCLVDGGGAVCSTCFDPDIIDGINIPNGEHRIFVTSTTYNGNLGGYDGACAKCAERAAAAGLQLTYKAILSDSNGSAASRIVFLGGAIVKIDDLGQRTNVDGDGNLWNGIQAPIDRTEFGIVVLSDVVVWTGTNANGTTTVFTTCANWTDGTPDDLGTRGRTDMITPSWISSGAQNCSIAQRLYCISQ